MTVLDLMEVYQITQDKESNFDFLKDILNEAGVNELIDRDVFSLEMLRHCGGRCPRYNTTATFKAFAINFFKTNKSYIDRTLELLAKEYDQLDTYNNTRSEKIDRVHTEDLQNVRTDDLREHKSESYSDEHFVSAENESGVQLRYRDTHSETDGENDGIFNTGTQTDKGDNKITHDDEINVTEHGYKTSPNVEFFNALKRNDFNFYSELAEKFADELCLCVF